MSRLAKLGVFRDTQGESAGKYFYNVQSLDKPWNTAGNAELVFELKTDDEEVSSFVNMLESARKEAARLGIKVCGF